MSKITLNDLAEQSATQAAESAGGSAEETGEWLESLYDKMRDDGYLDPLMEQLLGETRAMEQIQNEAQTAEPAAEAADDVEASMDELDAESIKEILLQVYDAAGMVPGLSDDPKLSELIQLIDANPEMADQLIGEYL